MFERGFGALTESYGWGVRKVVRRPRLMLGLTLLTLLALR